MNLRDLEYVVAVADYGHFGRAAAACNVSQPTLSGQILKLEAELGLRLFDREGRGARVSDRAATIVAQARATLASASGVTAAAQAARDPFAGELRLGVITTVAPYLLPIALPELSRALPRTPLYLVEDLTDRLLARLRDGALDAAAIATDPRDARLASIELYAEPFFRSFRKARARLHRCRGDRSEHAAPPGRGPLSARPGAGPVQHGGADGARRRRSRDEPRNAASSRLGRAGGDARAPPRLRRLAPLGRQDHGLEDRGRRRVAPGQARVQARLAARGRARGACRVVALDGRRGVGEVFARNRKGFEARLRAKLAPGEADCVASPFDALRRDAARGRSGLRPQNAYVTQPRFSGGWGRALSCERGIVKDF